MLPGIFEDLLGIRLFGYITFRVAMAGLTAFLLAMWWGKPVIAWLRRHSVGEDVEKAPLEELAKKGVEMGKKGTPTMGGSFLVASLLTSVVLWARLDALNVILAICLTAGLAAVGFVDDFKKLTTKKDGLTPRSKMVGLTAITLFCLCALAFFSHSTGRGTPMALYPPFLKDFSIPLGTMGLLGVGIFLVFEWFVIVGTANAVNITDGLDGLAAGCMLISGLALAIFCYVTGRADWTDYLNLPYVRDASEMAVVGGALVGACMGFLWYNAFPASVFMGDSGSLPLGGLLAWMALVSKQELVLPLIGLVFFVELASSALQTFYFKRTGGRRLFTVAPVHHGLQLKGGIFQPGEAAWHEVTIVVRAWIIAAACAMASLALLKVR